MSSKEIKLEAISISYPTAEHPYYHLIVRPTDTIDDIYEIKHITANGKWSRDFVVYNDGYQDRLNTMQDDADITIAVRVEWKNGENIHLIATGETEDGDKITLTGEFTAPNYGGYWNSNWKYYASVVVSESQDIARFADPVHATLGVYADRLTDPMKEVRVVRIDPNSGASKEVPSQVSEPSTWSALTNEHCQPTTTFDVAFLAEVPEMCSVVYLVFYGNPNAGKPNYATDLKVAGNGLALTVDNDFYQVKLHELSGSIEEVFLKQGVNAKFDHHLETNGCLHWNPDIYAPPRPWLHASDWNPPANYVTESGPIFFMTKRWGEMPNYPEVICEIQYIFYANNPEIMVSSTTHLIKDLDAVCVRNGEFVFNHDVVEEFAWKQPDGGIKSVFIKERPRHPSPGQDFEFDAPWWTLYNRSRRAAIAGITINVSNTRIGPGKERAPAYQYLHWGPWVYVSRPLVYSFITNNPQRVLRAHGNSIYYEKMALLPFKLGEDEQNFFDTVEDKTRMLFDPLDVKTVLDTDERVPVEWVPPILVEEFEELEDR